ncbi:AbiH family protein [Candidatus Merdisoma sp. JLR.KK006]|uniref:AbiH family protein n=1 Tax=Candidatus Merdisoma sp. JLR.KK006 TaxID=3112626 RepID=UPI002FEFA5DC
MKILVIGNGFDLAHELPTKYPDFLEFCKRVFPVYENTEGRGVNLYQQEYLFDWDFNKEIKEKLESVYSSRRKNTTKENVTQIETSNSKLDEMYTLIKDNIWIEYFFQCNMYQKENWIDFESEISKVIKALNEDVQAFKLENNIQRLSNIFLSEKYCNDPQTIFTYKGKQYYSQKLTYKILRDKLLDDLNRLVRAFEIYLTEYVEKINIRVVSPDIKEIAAITHDVNGKKSILFSKVISFNYSNIYEQLYLDKYKISNNDFLDYIHGKADINNTIDTNNMVLGIDEYLGKKKRNKQVEFVAFKKFYQRIHKGTGCTYKSWIDTIKGEFVDYQTELEKSKAEKNIMNLKAMANKIKKQYLNKHHLYIFGHSLDVTDKDILRDLILNDNVHTTIFYHDKDAMGQQIANLVKVFGQEELIRRTGGKEKLIEFKPQKPMIERKEE